MRLCPLDLRPCIDDICWNSGCLRDNGEAMVERCPGCQGLISVDGSQNNCECDEDDQDFEEY
jgi:hypothetical protein